MTLPEAPRTPEKLSRSTIYTASERNFKSFAGSELGNNENVLPKAKTKGKLYHAILHKNNERHDTITFNGTECTQGSIGLSDSALYDLILGDIQEDHGSNIFDGNGIILPEVATKYGIDASDGVTGPTVRRKIYEIGNPPRDRVSNTVAGTTSAREALRQEIAYTLPEINISTNVPRNSFTLQETIASFNVSLDQYDENNMGLSEDIDKAQSDISETIGRWIARDSIAHKSEISIQVSSNGKELIYNGTKYALDIAIDRSIIDLTIAGMFVSEQFEGADNIQETVTTIGTKLSETLVTRLKVLSNEQVDDYLGENRAIFDDIDAFSEHISTSLKGQAPEHLWAHIGSTPNLAELKSAIHLEFRASVAGQIDSDIPLDKAPSGVDPKSWHEKGVQFWGLDINSNSHKEIWKHASGLGKLGIAIGLIWSAYKTIKFIGGKLGGTGGFMNGMWQLLKIGGVAFIGNEISRGITKNKKSLWSNIWDQIDDGQSAFANKEASKYLRSAREDMIENIDTSKHSPKALSFNILLAGQSPQSMGDLGWISDITPETIRSERNTKRQHLMRSIYMMAEANGESLQKIEDSMKSGQESVYTQYDISGNENKDIYILQKEYQARELVELETQREQVGSFIEESKASLDVYGTATKIQNNGIDIPGIGINAHPITIQDIMDLISSDSISEGEEQLLEDISNMDNSTVSPIGIQETIANIWSEYQTINN